jgi:hypothetical protein
MHSKFTFEMLGSQLTCRCCPMFGMRLSFWRVSEAHAEIKWQSRFGSACSCFTCFIIVHSLILLDYIFRSVKIIRNHKLWSFALCNSQQSPVISPPLGPRILRSTLVPEILTSRCRSLLMFAQLSLQNYGTSCSERCCAETGPPGS